MITYDLRSQLYTTFEYSTNVITKVGGEPEEGWGGKNSKDKDTGRPLKTLYGVELEVSTDYATKDIVNAFPEIFAIGKKDSSVSGSKMNSIEIVTIPATLRKHKDMWLSFFDAVDEDKFDTMDRHTNGMHVHIDRRCFQKDCFQLKKFCYFFTNVANTEFLREISQRDNNSFTTYANPVISPNIRLAERTLQAQSKHCIVNLQHSATVEVRLFKGVVSFASIIKNLEFVDSVFEYSLKASATAMDMKSYLKWLNKLPKNQYVTLRTCIADMNIEEMLIVAGIKAAVTTMNPRNLDLAIRAGTVVIPAAYESMFIQEFIIKNDRSGWTIAKDGEFWKFSKAGTRFAKFDEQTFNMLQRGRLRQRATQVRNAA
jgi:hypothetical protein